VADPTGLVRGHIWWSAKVLPLIGAAALGAMAAGTPAADGIPRLAALLVSAAGLGAYAHLVNDWADIEVDAQAGKANLVGLVAPWARIGLVAASLCLGLAPWVFVSLGGGLRALLGSLVVLPLLYSARPLRLKARAAAGVLADALNAHVVPVAFSAALLAEAGHLDGAGRTAVAAAAVWALGFGVRSILVHQLGDETADRAARVRTFVVRHGVHRAVVVGRRAFGIELVGVAGVLVSLAVLAPGVLVFFGTYLAIWLLARDWSAHPYLPVPRDRTAWMPLSEFYVVWPAMAFAVALVVGSEDWWPLLAGIVVVFAPAVWKQTVDLADLLVAAGKTLGSGLHWVAWRLRDAAWRARVLWYDGWLGRVRYAAKRGVTRVWLFWRRQGRRFRRIVLRRPPTSA